MLQTLMETAVLEHRPPQKSRDFSVQVETPETSPKCSSEVPKKLSRASPVAYTKELLPTSKGSTSKHSHHSSPNCCNYHMRILVKEEHRVQDSLKQLDLLLQSKSQVFKSVKTSSPSLVSAKLRALSRARPKKWA